jgi:hypothetical protein
LMRSCSDTFTRLPPASRSYSCTSSIGATVRGIPSSAFFSAARSAAKMRPR